jgi:preprotein translocase subunit SecD
MRKRKATSLVVIVVVAIAALAYTFAADNSPQLGLDLQGGASVVLKPPSGTPSGTLDEAISIIRSRVDALGVAEPQITRQGSAVVVELPGVKDQARAVSIVGDTAELRFRPVLATLLPEGVTPSTTSTTSTTAAPGATTTSAPSTTTTAAAPAGGATTTTAPGATTTTTPTDNVKTTTREANKADAEVVLPMEATGKEKPLRLALGPAALLGNAVKTASAKLTGASGEWYVQLELKGDGAKKFNELAGTCFAKQPTCPTNQLAIELDGVVKSAPVFQAATFDGPVTITGSFKEREAKDLALVLRFGALPVQLEQQTVRTVSATLGKDSLHAGLIAGLIGTALVLLYILLYYRLLGLVVLLGLLVWAALQWAIISYLGATSGLALSLAGVTGIVVSVGITVDSYVVYFERIKDHTRAGRSVRSSVDRGFQQAFRTIIIADTTSFLGAAILYWLTVGSVRGFAFFLGLSTLLDVLVAWAFTRPLVALFARRGLFEESSFLRPHNRRATGASSTPTAEVAP